MNYFLPFICLLWVNFLLLTSDSLSHAGTALEDYVTAPDPSYGYQWVQTINRTGYTGYVLELTSQTWRTETEVNRTEWKHWVTIVVPATVPLFSASENALMFVVGADNDDPHDAAIVDYLAPVALAEQAVVISVEMVPNQPLTFADETHPRSSDAIIAYTWDKFFTTGDPTWIAQLPMTKSVVRAMDAVQHFCNTLTLPIDIEEFVISGASKHGWTTWLSAIVDSRVSAIIPIVIDLLNMDESFKHHFHAYGFWAPAVGDYEMAGVFERIDTPEMEALITIVDPYEYRTEVTIPRFIVNSAGDEFFLPDSSQFYYHDLPPVGSRAGSKYLRYIPNAGHSLDSIATIETLSMFFHAALSDSALPQFTWSFVDDNVIEVETGSHTPSQVKLWQAHNSENRDFRFTTIGNSWTSSSLVEIESGRYRAAVTIPSEGWVAYFIELSFPSGGLFDYTFTTDIRVSPDFLPFEADIDFDGEIEGDVDGDGYVRLEDAVTALQVAAGLTAATQINITSDYDGDRRVGIVEALYVLQYLLSR